MDFDSRQTRRLYLAGTVTFPTSFPSTGTVAIVNGCIVQPDDRQKDARVFVQLREVCGLDQTITRVIPGEDVAAIYFPHMAHDSEPECRSAEQVGICDFEQGVWFLTPHIDARRIADRLHADITTLESGVQGIVFVPEHRPVLTITECTQTARAASSRRPWHHCECEC